MDTTGSPQTAPNLDAGESEEQERHFNKRSIRSRGAATRASLAGNVWPIPACLRPSTPESNGAQSRSYRFQLLYVDRIGRIESIDRDPVGRSVGRRSTRSGPLASCRAHDGLLAGSRVQVGVVAGPRQARRPHQGQFCGARELGFRSTETWFGTRGAGLPVEGSECSEPFLFLVRSGRRGALSSPLSSKGNILVAGRASSSSMQQQTKGGTHICKPVFISWVDSTAALPSD